MGGRGWNYSLRQLLAGRPGTAQPFASYGLKSKGTDCKSDHLLLVLAQREIPQEREAEALAVSATLWSQGSGGPIGRARDTSLGEKLMSASKQRV